MELGFRTYGFLSLLGPNCPKINFKAPEPDFCSFGIKNLFHVKFHKILHKASPYFKNLDDFQQRNLFSKLAFTPCKAEQPL